MNRVYIKDEVFSKLFLESQIDALAVGLVGYDEELKKHYIVLEALEQNLLSCGNGCINNECDEKETSLYTEIINFLNQETGCNFKSGAKKTSDLISGRLKEGYTVDDFKRVIKSKVKDWKGDPKMQKFLKPSTLFAASNFEAYLFYAPPLEEQKQEQKQEQKGVEEFGVSLEW